MVDLREGRTMGGFEDSVLGQGVLILVKSVALR